MREIQPMIVRLAADDLMNKDRVTEFRENYSRAILKHDIEPLGDYPFKFEASLYALQDLGVAFGVSSPVIFPRTSQHVDGDNLILNISLSGGRIARQHGRELAVGAGEALLTTSAEPGVVTVSSISRFVSFRMARDSLQPMIADLDACLLRPIARNSDALRLLRSYAGVVKTTDVLASPEMRGLAVAHIHDLVSMVLGATRDATEIARGRGLRAARLHALKADIAANLTRRDLSIDTVAARQSISSRYVRKLFAEAGTSFSDFVLASRLARVHRMLCDSRYVGRSISGIAFACGFGDLSYFNQSFRRRYGATPSDVREAARRQRRD